MKILLVFAHPLEESLCDAFAASIRRGLTARGHDVVMERLCQAGFDPVLSPEERRSYYSGEYLPGDAEPYIRRLTEAEGLVLVFPTWWFGFPAVLKGWFDRAWAPTFAYDHASDLGPIRPKLDRLRKVLAVTTLGAPWWIDALVLGSPGQAHPETRHSGRLRPQRQPQVHRLPPVRAGLSRTDGGVFRDPRWSGPEMVLTPDPSSITPGPDPA